MAGKWRRLSRKKAEIKECKCMLSANDSDFCNTVNNGVSFVSLHPQCLANAGGCGISLNVMKSLAFVTFCNLMQCSMIFCHHGPTFHCVSFSAFLNATKHDKRLQKITKVQNTKKDKQMLMAVMLGIK